jgi:SAM-dependent methyltransferase
LKVDVKKRTARGFAYEWQRFSVAPQEMEDNFWGYFQFFSPEFFKDKGVLEAGSGMGRHTYFLAQLAREVVAIDLGEAIRVTAVHVAGHQNAYLIQADIDHLPFQPESFDFVCSIGVLHHLPNPEEGLCNLVHCLRPGGTLQTASKFCLHQWGLKPTLLDQCNPSNLKTLLPTYCGPSPAAVWLWGLVELMFVQQGRVNSPPA